MQDPNSESKVTSSVAWHAFAFCLIVASIFVSIFTPFWWAVAAAVGGVFVVEFMSRGKPPKYRRPD